MQRHEKVEVPYFSTFRNHLFESFFFIFFTLFHMLTCHHLFNYPEVSNIAHATKRTQVWQLISLILYCQSENFLLYVIYTTSIPNFMIRRVLHKICSQIILTFKFQLAWVVFWIRWKWLECGWVPVWGGLACCVWEYRKLGILWTLKLEALRSRALSSNQLIAKFLS